MYVILNNQSTSLGLIHGEKVYNIVITVIIIHSTKVHKFTNFVFNSLLLRVVAQAGTAYGKDNLV